MFSWSSKKDNKRRGRPSRDPDENEFGVKIDRGQDDKQLEAELRRLAGVSGLPDEDLNLNEAEEDEETELLRLIGGGKSGGRPKKTTESVQGVGDLSDITADVELGDDDVEVDENDPELLGELMELTNPEAAMEDLGPEEESDPEPEEKPASNGEPDIMSTLKERLKMYKTAEAKAKENNETSRARRFSRGIKTLDDLIKKAKAGKSVSPSDIPPVIALNLKPAPPPSEAPTEEKAEAPPEESNNGVSNEAAEESEGPSLSDSPVSQDSPPQQNIMATLIERLSVYRTAEAKAKEAGENLRARRFSRGIKTLQGLIKDTQAGKQVSMSDIPPMVALNLQPVPAPPPLNPNEPFPDRSEESLENEMGNINLAAACEDTESRGAQEQERNILDVLSERLRWYRDEEKKAIDNRENARARWFSRGIRVLQELIRQATAGKPILPDDIPPIISVDYRPVDALEDEPEEVEIESDNLVRSYDGAPEALSFAAVEDVDLDEELTFEDETPTSTLEGLLQRARFYGKVHQEAQEAGNSRLADQNERIVKVYLDAIKTYKSGGYVDVDKLPNPKGCPPIPLPFYAP